MPDSLVGIGILLIIVGFAVVVFSLFSRGDVKIGVGGVIGFIPFGFGNDPQMAKIAIIISVVMALAFLVMALRGFRVI